MLGCVTMANCSSSPCRVGNSFHSQSPSKVFLFCKAVHTVPKMGPPGGPIFGPCSSSGSFFEVCCIKVAEAQRFGFNEAPRLREALLSEAGFEKGFPDPELGPSEEAVL